MIKFDLAETSSQNVSKQHILDDLVSTAESMMCGNDVLIESGYHYQWSS